MREIDKGLDIYRAPFIEWCKKNGIEMVLLDLDDTICPTRQLFKDALSNVSDLLTTNVPIRSLEEWRIEIHAINNQLFEEVGVNPKRGDLLVDRLVIRYSIDKDIAKEAKKILTSIYTTPLKLFDGAGEALEFLRVSGIPVGMVTHANEEWTKRKYSWLGLERFLTWKDVFIVDEDGQKTAESWKAAIDYFGGKPENCIVIGDSPRSDINPAREIGVKHIFLVDHPSHWETQEQPVDGSVRRIKRLDEIPLAILGPQF